MEFRIHIQVVEAEHDTYTEYKPVQAIVKHATYNQADYLSLQMYDGMVLPIMIKIEDIKKFFRAENL